VNINSASETIREMNIKISAKDSLGFYELKSIIHGSRKDSQYC
jgi:hypothetical protein